MGGSCHSTRPLKCVDGTTIPAGSTLASRNPRKSCLRKFAPRERNLPSFPLWGASGGRADGTSESQSKRRKFRPHGPEVAVGGRGGRNQGIGFGRSGPDVDPLSLLLLHTPGTVNWTHCTPSEVCAGHTSEGPGTPAAEAQLGITVEVRVHRNFTPVSTRGDPVRRQGCGRRSRVRSSVKGVAVMGVGPFPSGTGPDRGALPDPHSRSLYWLRLL